MIEYIVPAFSVIPIYFYFSGEKYSDNKYVKKIFKNFVWVYSQFEIHLKPTDESSENVVLESIIKMDNYNFHEYRLKHNEKNYYITLVNNDNQIHNIKLEKLQKNIEKKVENKNLIVHCSLINKDEDIVLDVTEDFRKFKFYYDEQCGESYVKYFLEYLKKKYNTLDLSNLTLMIYKNDEQFTELRHNIENLYTKTFLEILN